MDHLHIANGHVLASLLNESGLQGRIVVYADVLHEGPVLDDQDFDAHALVRARYHADQGWGGLDQCLETLRNWQRDFLALTGAEETVLWFEHDLYDQLLLVRHLNQLARLRIDPGKVSLICIDRHPAVARFMGLGQLSPQHLRELLPGRQPITADQVQLAEHVWHALVSPDPRGLESLLLTDLAPLKFLRDALVRFFEQYPSTFNGLCLTEQHITDSLNAGLTRCDELFRADQAAEVAPFMGDTTFFGYLQQLINCHHPLVAAAKLHADDPMPTWNLSLTDFGQSVRIGKSDMIRTHGIDVWRGGVHLHGNQAKYRWHPTRACLEQMY